MNRFAAAAVALLLGLPAAASQRVVVLADDYSRAEAEAVLARLGPVFETLRPGDRLTGLGPGAASEIFDAALPDEPIYGRHPVHRRKALRPAFDALVAHLGRAVAAREAADPAAPKAQVNLPAALEALGYQAASAPEIAVFGNPLFEDPRSPWASFAHGYPNDAHLLYGRDRTPFGARGLEGRLKGLQVHFCATEAPWLNAAHEEGVHRVYALLVEAHGGRLATFSADLAACADRFLAGDAAGARAFARDPGQTEPKMIDFRLPQEPVASIGELPAEAVTDAQALADAIARGDVVVHELELFDNGDEDGDVVKLVADGFEQIVALKKRPQRLRVPVTRGALRVVAVRDGTGGVTVAVRTAAGREVVSGKMAVGETIDVVLGGGS